LPIPLELRHAQIYFPISLVSADVKLREWTTNNSGNVRLWRHLPDTPQDTAIR